MIVTTTTDTTLTVDFEDSLDPSRSPLTDPRSYQITSEDGVPVSVRSVELVYSVSASGTGGPFQPATSALTVSRFIMGPGHGVLNGFLNLGAPYHENWIRISGVLGNDAIFLDRKIPVNDPSGGMIPWENSSGVESVILTLDHQPTDGATYDVSTKGLVRTFAVEPRTYTQTDSFVSSTSLPEVVGAEQLDEGQVKVTFDKRMRHDEDLTDPSKYSITGPSTVAVKKAYSLSDTEVLLTTSGLADGVYTLTADASGTPHDLSGNPLNPAANTAMFTGSPALNSRSIFTDKGPIAKPELSLQTGADATIDSPTQLTIPSAVFDPSHVGLYLRLTGSTTNGGDFRIVTRVSATVVRVVASFTLPDAVNGSIGWELYDPRDGEIADAPEDVTVRINGNPVVPDAVIGLLGQIILPTVPDPSDTVEVDYCWICNPVVDVRRLNSQEFKLNNWNRESGRPDSTQHKYRYNNTLVEPETYMPLDLQATLAQPLQRDLKYRAYERAYSTALNDPSLLLLNSPVHKISFPPMSRTLETEFVDYQPTTLPQNNPANPWTLEGAGNASLVSDTLVAEDTTTGPFPGGEPFFWSRPIDLTYPHVFAIAWRVLINNITTYDGVFTGVAAGYADDQKAVVVGLLEDGGTKKIGLLRHGAGNDPSELTSWLGGVDGNGDPTNAPADLDWSILRSYRVFRDAGGLVSVYVDGSVTPLLQALPGDLPNLEELNAPFDELQGAFFGSLSREAQNESSWSFVRYTSIPINPLQSAPSTYVSYEGTSPPEEASQPWTPVGFHGTDTIISSDSLLLDSTSATDLPSSDAAGLVSGDFRGFSRIEPLLSKSFNTVLDVNVALRTYTHGITPNAVLAAIDDGKRVIQLSFFPESASPKFSYGGRALPGEFEPYLWDVSGGASGSMVGQYLEIEDTTALDGLVYYLEGTEIVGAADRVVDHTQDYMLEFRVLVTDYTADLGGFAGVMSSVYDSLRSVGVMLEEVAGQRYVTLQSDGVAVVGGQFAFDWFDGAFHTYRATKSTAGNLVSLFIDGEFVGSVNYSDFASPPPALTGMVSFGSATPISTQSTSTAQWAYSNYWKVDSTVRKYAGIWKGYDSNALTGYHLPVRAEGDAAILSNVLTDITADFTAAGVLVGEQIVVDYGPNKGVYTIAAVSPGGNTTKITLDTIPPSQPTEMPYRVVREVDWTTQHKYRIVKDPGGGVNVYLDADPSPWIHADYSTIDLPDSSEGLARTIAGSLPSVLWGAFDPTNISQTSWDHVRLGAVRSQTELGIVPHHQVLNQRNIMASYEHHQTVLAHDHTNFWSESEGIPPQTDPDFLMDPDLVAYTLLNEGTPLVPSTQTYEVRSPQAVLTALSGLNNPEDVINDQGFLLNNYEQTIKILVPDDVLYNCLKVIERTTGDTNLIAPFDDECQPYTLGTLSFQNEVCLTYDGAVLPENDVTAATPWTLASDDGSHVFANAFAGILTYGTDGVGTRTVYRNNTPLPDAISLQTEVKFRLKILQDSTGGLGDSQVRVGFSSPGATIGLAFVTTPVGQRYVLAVDLNSGATVGGIQFDFYDGDYHDYRLVRDPGSAAIQIFIDS